MKIHVSRFLFISGSLLYSVLERQTESGEERFIEVSIASEAGRKRQTQEIPMTSLTEMESVIFMLEKSSGGFWSKSTESSNSRWTVMF